MYLLCTRWMCIFTRLGFCRQASRVVAEGFAQKCQTPIEFHDMGAHLSSSSEHCSNRIDGLRGRRYLEFEVRTMYTTIYPSHHVFSSENLQSHNLDVFVVHPPPLPTAVELLVTNRLRITHFTMLQEVRRCRRDLDDSDIPSHLLSSRPSTSYRSRYTSS